MSQATRMPSFLIIFPPASWRTLTFTGGTLINQLALHIKRRLLHFPRLHARHTVMALQSTCFSFLAWIDVCLLCGGRLITATTPVSFSSGDLHLTSSYLWRVALPLALPAKIWRNLTVLDFLLIA